MREGVVLEEEGEDGGSSGSQEVMDVCSSGGAAAMAGVNGVAARGAAKGPRGCEAARGVELDKNELLRILVQSLDELGLERSARHLEQESGVQALAPEVVLFRDCVMRGEWARAEGVLAGLDAFASTEHNRLARAVICEQKYLEMLEVQDCARAVECLQHELAVLLDPAGQGMEHDRQRLHELTLLLMCQSRQELHQRAKWPGACTQSRLKVMARLHELMKASVLIPESRLEVLLKRALTQQAEVAMFPYTRQERMGLLEDLTYDPEKVPHVTHHILREHTDEVWFVQFSHDGTRLASASRDMTVKIFDMEASPPRRVLQLEGHMDALSFLAWSHNDRYLLSCGNDRVIRLWNTSSGGCEAEFNKHTESVTSCAWLPGDKQFISGGLDRRCHLFDVESRTCIYTFEHGVRVSDLAVSADGKKMVTISSEKRIFVHDLETRLPDGQISESENLTSISLSDDGNTLLVNLSSQTQPEIHAWDLQERRIVQKYRGQQQVRFVIRSCFGGANQMFVLSGSEDNRVFMWNRASGELLLSLEGHTGTVNCVAWNPKRHDQWCSASDDCSIRIWGPKRSAPAQPSLSPTAAAEPSRSEPNPLDVACGSTSPQHMEES
ncbi:WD repeat-containing protein 26 [Porphyridium purpureum]|uniref:WD repeat-containing protein 26 n=1 Tax=Porphyridium purpureum TaxID=35688 RepID=A0A5J4YTE9_PORPP|nr:WD repeat-containing protein 26 [Porphyridium purpureum]|eukprot:POR2779..scf227_4